MINYIKIFTFLAAIIIADILYAQKISTSLSQSVIDDFIQTTGQKEDSLTVIPVLSLDKDTLAYIYNFNSAFIVVGNYYDFAPVKAFSLNHSFRSNSSETNSQIDLKYLLTEDYRLQNKNRKVLKMKNEKVRKSWDKHRFYSSIKNSMQYGPLLNSEYGQVNCKNENGNTINVTNLFTPNNYAAGCVAICFTAAMRYYEWPRKGKNSHTYSDNYGSSNGTYSVNFEDNYYNWSLIRDKYQNMQSSLMEREELGRLTFHAAVAIDMDFEYNGSTSNVNRIPSAATNYFRYTAEFAESDSYNFWPDLDTNMVLGYPVQLSIYSTNGAGHAIVCDGFIDGTSKYYHLNMGWWGDDNAWYLLQNSWNAGGYSILSGMVYNLWPVPEMDDIDIDFENNTLDINWFYSRQIIPEAYELQSKSLAGEWESLSTDLHDTHFQFQYAEDETYSFRVRAKNMGKWKNNGWSNSSTIIISEQIEENGSSNLFLYPVIALDNILIKYKNLAGANIRIFGTDSRLVYEGNLPDDNGTFIEHSLNVTNYNRGLYFVEIKVDNMKKTLHFIKSN
ncbi:MAG: C10 family peptidase [Bacteroidota bacterium]|nr:C10 family peptidase [Bacteroidota bacterium]